MSVPFEPSWSRPSEEARVLQGGWSDLQPVFLRTHGFVHGVEPTATNWESPAKAVGPLAVRIQFAEHRLCCTEASKDREER